jgi:hypothetical protein
MGKMAKTKMRTLMPQNKLSKQDMLTCKEII